MRTSEYRVWTTQARAAIAFNLGEEALFPPPVVLPIMPPSDDLGFTSESREIYVALDHPAFRELEPAEQLLFRTGVAVHEILHQIFTDFSFSKKTADAIRSKYERQIFMILANVLEDPAIEHFAPLAVGKGLVEALRYSIAVIYKNSPPISESGTPFAQYVNALINFGDMGLLKGHFTFPEAEKAFRETASLFYSGITCPDAAKRIKIAKEIFNLTRDLWECEAKAAEAAEREMKALQEMLKKLGKEILNASGSGSGSPLTIELDLDGDGDGEGGSGSSGSAKDARRRKMLKKLSESSSSPGSSSGDSSDADSSSGGPSASGSASDSKASKDAARSAGSESSSESGKEADKETGEKGKDGTSSKSEEADKTPDASETKPSEGGEPDDIYSGELSKKELEVSLDAKEFIKELKREMREEDAKEAKAEAEKETRTKVSGGSSSYVRTLRTIVPTASADDINYYNEIVAENRWEIRRLVERLAPFFMEDAEETEWAARGRLSPLRTVVRPGSTKIFEKRMSPDSAESFAVSILVDESGSMRSASRCIIARAAAICLAEVFSQIGVPLTISGFTADERPNEVEHRKYVSWTSGKNKAARASLAQISARVENADGFSIRAAAEELYKFPAEKRMLLVISDGQPSASSYRGLAAINDTEQAVSAARRKLLLYGIDIGRCDVDALSKIYKESFISINDTSQLFTELTKKLIPFLTQK